MGLIPGQSITAHDIKAYSNRYDIGRESVPTKVIVTGCAPWKWMVAQLHTPGWECIAVGTMPEATSAKSVAKTIEVLYGDGFARLPRERFVTKREGGKTICISRTDGSGTYCGGSAAVPYVHVRGRYQQHHIACMDAYRAEHYGRCPVEN